MIDIHCHILPGLDDGAKTINESLEIARELVEAGYTTVIATPHVFEARVMIHPDQIRQNVKMMNQVLEEESIPLKVLPGAEIFIFPDMAKWFKEGKLLSLGDTGRYILVELPMLNIPSYTEQVFFDLQILGLTPIVAHPERNREILDSPDVLGKWAEKGIRIQVNIGSFMGKYGMKTKKFAQELYVTGMVDFLGSDYHQAGRGLDLRDIHFYFKEFGTSRLTAAIAENPTSILEGQSLMPKQVYSGFHTKKERTFRESLRERFI
ncbi:MAG: histidinol-phosphatase [Peptococcaceae bacterium]|nr:histidinol-phosphatase [Peptococcaceae bacterium]